MLTANQPLPPHLLLSLLALTACGAPVEEPADTGDTFETSDTSDTVDTSVADTDPADTDPLDTADTDPDAPDDTDAADTDDTDLEDTDDTDGTDLMGLASGWGAPVPAEAAGLIDGAASATLELVVGDPVADRAVNVAVQGLPEGVGAALFRGDRADGSACASPCLTSSTASFLGVVAADAAGVAEWSVAVPDGEAGEWSAFEAVRVDGTARSPAEVVQGVDTQPQPYARMWGSEGLDGWTWVSFGERPVYRYGADVVIARNAMTSAFNPGLWSRFDLVQSEGDWFYCQTVFDGATFDAAASAAPADRSDLLAGCGGMFPWSVFLAEDNPWAGTYTDAFGTGHELGEALWTQTFPGGGSATFEIATVGPDGDWIVARNGAANTFNPGLWSRFDLVEDGGSLWSCQTVFDGSSWLEARRATPADASDRSAGCSGFPWTDMGGAP